MLGLVLGGGGNYGAMQAGALEVLLGTGLRPDMVVGTSAGALNAIYLASDPTPAGMWSLQQTWREARQDLVGSISLLGGLQRIVTNRPSLFANRRLAEFVESHLPLGVATFGELRRLNGVRAYALATCLDTGQAAVFGDDDGDRLLDGAMASSSLPPYLPPWVIQGRRYVDGAVYANVPIKVAIQRGASQLISIEIRRSAATAAPSDHIFDVSTSALTLMVEHMADLECEWAEHEGVALRRIGLQPPPEVRFWDYGQAERLIGAGRLAMQAALNDEPVHVLADWRSQLKRNLAWLRRALG